MKLLLFISILLFLYGCDGGSSNKNEEDNVCGDPIAVSGDDSDLGYIVFVNDDVDANAYSTELIEEYGDKINVYTTGSGFFAAGFGSDVLEIIRCDYRIKSISYEGVASVTES